MKNLVLILLALVFVGNISIVGAQTEVSGSDAAYWEQKKLTAQEASTKMRLEYYEKYKAKGYDVSIISGDLLDGKKTEEYKFWDALKKMQNLKEIPERRTYVEKLAKYGADVSIFTEDVIADSGKFWEYYKKVEASLATKKEETWTNKTPVKTEVKEVKKEVSQGEMKKEVQQTPGQSRTIKLFIERLDKVPADKLPATLEKLDASIKKQLEIARTRSSKILIAKLEMMQKIVEERMGDMDDESLIESLFR